MRRFDIVRMMALALTIVAMEYSFTTMDVFANNPIEEETPGVGQEQEGLCINPADSDDVYVQITSDNETSYRMADDYNDVIGLTNGEVLDLYNAFLASRPEITSEEQPPQKTVEEFVQYAVDQGVIQDEPVQKAAITKAVVRAEFKAVVAGGNAAGYTTAAAFLNHSLQDTPSNLSYSSGTTYSDQIKKSSEYKSILNKFKSDVKGKKLTQRTTSGSTTLNSTTDLHLAYNKVSYTAYGTKKNSTWTLNVVFTDTYDFEKESWKNAMTSNAAVTAINNYAAYAQSLGAIVPYKISVTVTATFSE